MRNLILFLTRNSYFILFLFLESLALFLVFQNNHFQRAHFLNSSNAIAGNIYKSYSGVTEYFGLKKENRKLAEENVALRNQLRESFSKEFKQPMFVQDSLHNKQYLFLSAKVVNNSTNRPDNYITLNIGSKAGVKSGDAVIASDGVVGIVRDVSDNFSSVMSALNEKSAVSVVIKKFNEPSILKWNGIDEDYALLERVPSHLELLKGDTITTSPSSTFPEGIMVGYVESYEKIAGNTFYNVTIKLSTDFSQLRYVTVVKNLLREEQTNLEKTTQHD